MVCQDEVQHGGLVHDQQVAGEGVLLVALEGEAGGGLELEQPVDRLGRTAGGFGEALSGAAGGRGKDCFGAGLLAEVDDGAYNGRLACTRPPREDGQPVGEGSLDCLLLKRCQAEGALMVGELGLKLGEDQIPVPVLEGCERAGRG